METYRAVSGREGLGAVSGLLGVLLLRATGKLRRPTSLASPLGEGPAPLESPELSMSLRR